MTPHWYFVYYTQCPVCGRTRKERTRMYTPKPENWADRHKESDIWDGCNY